MRKLIMPTYGGIYKIVNMVNGKMYIGSAENFRKRWKDHLGLLRKGIHHSPHLQYAFNLDGRKNFVLMIQESIDDLNQLIPREQYWKDFYKSYDPNYGYDICRYAGSRKGMKHTKEAIAKMIENGKKRWKNLEYKTKMIEINKELWKDPKYKERMSKIHKDRLSNPETKSMLSEIRKNTWKNPEHRVKILSSNEIRRKDPNYKDGRSEYLKEKWKDPEYRKRMKDLRKGQKRSPEVKAKIKEASILEWANPECRVRIIKARWGIK